MIKYNKIIISLLLAYAFFIVGIFNVHALDINELKDFTQLQFSNDFDATEFWNTDQDAVAVFTKTFNIGTYDSGADYIVYHGFIDLFSYKSTKTNTMDPTYIKYATKVYLTTQDNEIVICENNMTESGYIICRNPKKMVNTISFFTSFNTLGTALDDNYYYKVHLYKTFWYANKVDSNNSSTLNSINTNTQNINSNITDSSIDSNNTSSSVGGFSSSTNSSMSNTPVSSMISLPITFLTGVNNALSNSCTNVNYIELFGYQLVLPCLNLSERLGSVWTIIDTIFSCMLIFSIGKSLVSTFARLSDMDTNIMYECYANGTKHRGESFDD